MDALSVASNLIGIADVAGKVLSRLYKLNEIWSSAPQEVVRLTNTVHAVQQLLSSLRDPLAAGALVPPGQPSNHLLADLSVAEETLKQMDSILERVDGHPTVLPTTTATAADLLRSAKARWAMHRDTIRGLQEELHGHLQRVCTRLQLANV